MKITTTFWSDKVVEFDKLLYINGKTKEAVFEVDLNDKYATYLFFKNIAKFVKSQNVLKTYGTDEYYQFATIYEKEVCPIKWFNVVIHEKLIISHDIAFSTTLIMRNDVRIPFGKFPMWLEKRLSKHREYKMKAKAYNFIANELKKNLGN